MKRFLAMIVTISLLTNAYAESSPSRQLESAINKANFELSQLESLDDPNRDKVIESLKEDLLELNESGLTRDQILDEIKSLSKNPMTTNEIDFLIFETSINSLPQDKFLDYALKKIEESQATGSNFIGNTSTAESLVIVLFVVIIVAAIALPTCEEAGGTRIQTGECYEKRRSFDDGGGTYTYCPSECIFD